LIIRSRIQQIDARLVALDAKSKAQAAKRAKASK
jgi:hypothetical protein